MVDSVKSLQLLTHITFEFKIGPLDGIQQIEEMAKTLNSGYKCATTMDGIYGLRLPYRDE